MTYERHGKGQAQYANESAERIWFRFYNNTTCSITILAGSPIVVETLPDGKAHVTRPYGDWVNMDLEVTDPSTGRLDLAYGGHTRSETVMAPGESVSFDAAASHLRSGRIAVRFRYEWDGGTDLVEHRAVFDPRGLPPNVREWLARAGAGKDGKTEPPSVDVCVLQARPPEYRGRLVHVMGELVSGREGLQLRGDCGGAREPLCLDMAPDSTTPPEREIEAVAEVSEEEFIRSRNLKETWDAMPWTPLEYEPVVGRHDKRWRELARLRGPFGETRVTVVGRFEYINTPSWVRYRNGHGDFIRGYGLVGACRAQIVVSEVLSIETSAR